MRARLVLLVALLSGVWLSAQPPAPVTNPQMALLQVVVTSPTTGATYDAGTSDTLTTLSGTATGSHPILTCTWSNSLGGSGTTTGTTSWSITSVALTVGSNVITVTCLTDQGLSRSDVVTVTRSAVTSNPIAAARLPGGDATLPVPAWGTYAGVDGGIPARTTQCVTASCNTLASGTVTATTIQNALGSAPADTYVLVPAGSFSIGGFTFNESHVTLRGAGADSTKLSFTGTVGGCGIGLGSSIRFCTGSNGIACQPWCGGSTNVKHIVTWSSGYPQGSTTVVLSSVSGLTVGSVMYLEQLDDASDGWPAAGDMYVCSGANPCSAQGFGAGYGFRQGRVHQEVHEVVSCGTSTPGAACSSTTVVIEPPIHYPSYRSGQTPMAWWEDRTDLVEMSGIEDMTLDFTGAGATPGITAVDLKNAWFKGLRLIRNSGANDGFLIQPIQSYRVSTVDNYLYGPTTQALRQYAYAPIGAGSMLFQNNICHFNTACITSNDPEVGSVHAYNYGDGNFFSQPAQPHNSGDAYHLYEGNDFSGFHGEEIHGTHHFITLFRNYFNRTQHATNFAAAGNGITLWSRNRFYNILGNVLGHSSFTTYQTTTIDAGGSGTAIYNVDNKGNCTGCSGLENDANVSRTLFRWGNWDSVTSTGSDDGPNDTDGIRWNTGEVPSGITNFANPVPGSQVLPSSLYLSAKPSWFGSVAWPPIGPDVTSSDVNTATGGHANKIPARLCFEAATNDPAYSSSSPRIKLGVGSNCPVP